MAEFIYFNNFFAFSSLIRSRFWYRNERWLFKSTNFSFCCCCCHRQSSLCCCFYFAGFYSTHWVKKTEIKLPYWRIIIHFYNIPFDVARAPFSFRSTRSIALIYLIVCWFFFFVAVVYIAHVCVTSLFCL